ncbi:MAG: PaaI family thioesterase [Actinomycetota bacterium]|nr:PaaI family thioesterase [Actinomycetota bacterium]
MANLWLDSVRGAFDGVDVPRRSQFARIGRATRRIIESVVASKAPTDELKNLADEIEEVATRIEKYPRGRVYEGFAEAANSGGNVSFMDFSPISGEANPIAAPVRLSVVQSASGESMIVGEVTFNAAYEGPPGCVHGGHLAAAFDEVLGLAQSLSGSPGMTARLTVNYRKPTPLHQSLRFEAKISHREGRKVFTEGKCYVGEVVTAEADALFISVDFTSLADLAAKRERDETSKGQ